MIRVTAFPMYRDGRSDDLLASVEHESLAVAFKLLGERVAEARVQGLYLNATAIDVTVELPGWLCESEVETLSGPYACGEWNADAASGGPANRCGFCGSPRPVEVEA